MSILQDPKNNGLVVISKEDYDQKMSTDYSLRIIEKVAQIKAIGCKVSPITLIFFNYSR
jgi:PHD/YefM family antitoxin component YafN of YafNO toxin-antitoxin module